MPTPLPARLPLTLAAFTVKHEQFSAPLGQIAEYPVIEQSPATGPLIVPVIVPFRTLVATAAACRALAPAAPTAMKTTVITSARLYIRHLSLFLPGFLNATETSENNNGRFDRPCRGL